MLYPYEDFYLDETNSTDDVLYFEDGYNTYIVQSYCSYNIYNFIDNGTIPSEYSYYNVDYELYNEYTLVNGSSVVVAMEEYGYNGGDYRIAHILLPYTDSYGYEDAIQITFLGDYSENWTLDDVRVAASQILYAY